MNAAEVCVRLGAREPVGAIWSDRLHSNFDSDGFFTHDRVRGLPFLFTGIALNMRRDQNQVGVANPALGAGSVDYWHVARTAVQAAHVADPQAVPAAQPEFCRMFKDSRRIQRLSQFELAYRLGTHPEVIDALECGRLEALPPWPDTIRIVAGFLAPLNIDPRPVLHMIAYEFAAAGDARSLVPDTAQSPISGVAAAPFATSGQTVAAHEYTAKSPPAPVLRQRGKVGIFARGIGDRVRHAAAGLTSARGMMPDFGGWPVRIGNRLRRRSSRRALLGLGVPLLFVFGVSQSNVGAATSAVLPAPVARAFASAHEYLRIQFAPVRDGLRWIEVDDPRSRRGDKMQTSRR